MTDREKTILLLRGLFNQYLFNPSGKYNLTPEIIKVGWLPEYAVNGLKRALYIKDDIRQVGNEYYCRIARGGIKLLDPKFFTETIEKAKNMLYASERGHFHA